MDSFVRPSDSTCISSSACDGTGGFTLVDAWTPLAAISAAAGTLLLIIAAVYAHCRPGESRA